MAETGTPRRSSAWSGWVTFAGVLLAVLGVLNILEGLVALLQSQVAFIDGSSLVVVNLTGLGIVMIVFGALLTACGIGLLAHNRVARIAAIVIVALHALAQIGSLGGYPVWSLLMITLDVIILYALTVHWAPLQLEPATPPPGGVHRADRDQQREATTFPMNPPRGGPAHAAPDTPDVSEKAPGGYEGQPTQYRSRAAEYEAEEYQGQRRGSYQPGGEPAQGQQGQPGPNPGPYPPTHTSSPTSGSGHGTGAA